MKLSDRIHTSAALISGLNPATHCIGGWLGPRAGLNDLEKRKSHVAAGIRTPAVYTWGVQVLRSPNFFFSGMEADRNVKVVGGDVVIL